MENSPTANFANDFSTEQVLIPDLAGDYLWKPLYSHSYTLFFNCATCSHQFDIDGWFYQFDILICPQCHTVYSGVFGKTLPGSILTSDKSQKNVLKLETFDSHEVEVPLSSNPFLSKVQMDHIFLIIFAKANEKGNKPWCAVDWSVKNSPPIYLQSPSNTVPIKKGKTSPKKSGLIFPYILLGIFMVIGLFSLYFYLF